MARAELIRYPSYRTAYAYTRPRTSASTAARKNPRERGRKPRKHKKSLWMLATVIFGIMVISSGVFCRPFGFTMLWNCNLGEFHGAVERVFDRPLAISFVSGAVSSPSRSCTGVWTCGFAAKSGWRMFSLCYSCRSPECVAVIDGWKLAYHSPNVEIVC